MSDKPKSKIDYEQCRNDISSSIARGDLTMADGRKPETVRVGADRLAACRRVHSALFADESLSVLSACVAEGIATHSYIYARDAGLI